MCSQPSPQLWIWSGAMAAGAPSKLRQALARDGAAPSERDGRANPRRVWALRKWDVSPAARGAHDWANEARDAVRLARVHARIERVIDMRRGAEAR